MKRIHKGSVKLYSFKRSGLNYSTLMIKISCPVTTIINQHRKQKRLNLSQSAHCFQTTEHYWQCAG